MQIKLNFDISQKRESTKKVFIESKSSNRNIGETFEQINKHAEYLVANKLQIEESLFLLFIQNHPNKISIDEFKGLLNLERNVAVILMITYFLKIFLMSEILNISKILC